MGGYIVVKISSIVVTQNNAVANQYINDINDQNRSSQLNKILFSGNSQQVSRLVSGVSSILNSQSISNKVSLQVNSTQKQFLTNLGPNINISFGTNFENINSISPTYIGVVSLQVKIKNT